MEYMVVYRGNLAALRALDPASILTVIDFNCQELELFEVNQVEDPCVSVTVDDDNVLQLTVCRGPATENFQFQIPGLLHDDDLRTEGVVTKPPVERMDTIREALQAGQPLGAVDDGDLFIRSLRALFARFRSEGGLVRQSHLLTSLSVRYVNQKPPKMPIFTVEYHNRPVLV